MQTPKVFIADAEIEEWRRKFHEMEAPPPQAQSTSDPLRAQSTGVPPQSRSTGVPEAPGIDVEDDVLSPERRFPVGLNRDPNSDYGRRVFRHEGYGYVTFNGAEHLPETNDPTYVWPRYLKNMHMGSNEYPYAAYVLKNPRYDNNEFLKRLNISFHTVPFERIGDERKGFSYRMEPDKAYAWQRLENAVLFTVKTIRRYYDCYYNLSFSPPRLPSSYGYLGTYSTLRDLRRRVMTSRDSFDLLFAYLAYYLSGTPSTTMTSAVNVNRYVRQGSSGRTSGGDTLCDSLPLWAQEAINDGLMHPVWVDMVLFSEISNFTRRRAGVCIDPDDCEFLYTIARLLARKIEFVVKWPLLADDYAKDKFWELAERILQLIRLTLDERKRLVLEWKNEPERPLVIRPLHAGLAAARLAQTLYMNHQGPNPLDHPVIPQLGVARVNARGVGVGPRRFPSPADLPVPGPSGDGQVNARGVGVGPSRFPSPPDLPGPSGDGQVNERSVGVGPGRFPSPADLPHPPPSGDDNPGQSGDDIPWQIDTVWDLNRTLAKPAQRRHGQLENEHWSEFLERRKEKNKGIQEKQSHQEKLKILSWIATAKKGEIMNKSVVYAWEKETEDGVRYRNLLTKFEGKRRLESCRESTKIYDPYENCWDICSEFDFPAEEGDTYPSDEEDLYDDSPIQDTESRVPLHKILSETDASAQDALTFDDWSEFILSATDFNESTLEEFKCRAESTARDLVRLEATMRKIYGFRPTSRSYPDFSEALDPRDEKTMVNARRVLGDGTTALKDDSILRRHVINFALALGAWQLKKRKPIVENALWDVSPGHFDYGWKRRSGIEVTPVVRESGTLFKISVKREHNCAVEIMVPDAMIAVACMRMDFESGQDIYHFLSSRGCEFIAIPKVPHSIQKGREVSVLGWREEGYVPEMADYAVYVRRVEALLEGRLAAALRMGGLFWCLAMYYSREKVTNETFMNCYLMEVEPLTKSEQDILVGKYNVYTGMLLPYFTKLDTRR